MRGPVSTSAGLPKTFGCAFQEPPCVQTNITVTSRKSLVRNQLPRLVRRITVHGFHRRFVRCFQRKWVIAMFSTNSLQSFLAQLSVVCFFLAANANAGLSQTSTATLTGIVQDSTGAVLPNVTVSV